MGLFLGSTTIHASPKYKRDAAPISPPTTKASAPTLDHDSLPAKPLQFDQHLAIESKKRRIAKGIISRYVSLIKGSELSEPNLPDYLFRLAEAYAQNQRHWRFRAMSMYPNIDSAKGAAKKIFVRRQKQFFKLASTSEKNSIRSYKTLVNNENFSTYHRMHEALFYLAYSLKQAKNITESQEVYHQLLTDYPNSKYVPQAYLSLADHFFEKDDLTTAARLYDKVLAFPMHTIYPLALYKRGWVYRNQGSTQDALDSFYRVASITKGKADSKSLNKAAKRDFVRAYAKVGKVRRALDAFNRVDNTYAFAMLELLAASYLEQGEGARATYTYRQLIALRSESPKLCQWQSRILSAVFTEGERSQKVSELLKLLKGYKAHRDSGVLSGSALNECQTIAQQTSSDMALTWHSEAMVTKNSSQLHGIKSIYLAYLKTFPKAKNIGEMRYYYADLLWYQASAEKNKRLASLRWEESAQAFTSAVESGALKGKRLKDAAYAPVLAWKNALDIDPRTDTSAIDQDPQISDKFGRTKLPKPKAITRRNREMIKAFDLYQKYVDKGDPERTLMVFYKARIYWRANQLAKALPLLRTVVEGDPKHEVAGTSARLIADCLSRLGRHNELASFASKTLSDIDFMKDKDSLRTILVDLRVVGIRLAAESLEAEKRFLACAQKYLSIWNEFPQSSNMDQVLYNAGRCFQKAKSIGLAIQSFAKLDKEFPDSPWTKKSLVLVGNAYGAIAAYEKSAEMYEEYATRFPGEKDAPDALNNALTYRKGIGHSSKAAEDINNFVRRYQSKRIDESASALLGLAGVYESSGDTRSEIKAYRRYLREMGDRGGFTRNLIAKAKLGQLLWKASCPNSSINGACIKVSRERSLHRTKHRVPSLALPERCGDASKNKVVLLRRNRQLAKEAQTYFRQVETMATPKELAQLSAKTRAQTFYWLSASRFYTNELAYENFLSLRFPQTLNFPPNDPKTSERSRKIFANWLQEKSKRMLQVKEEYIKIKNAREGGPVWVLASAARIGQMYQNYSGELFSAAIPKNVRTGPYAIDKVDAFCDELTTEAGPLEDASIQAYGFCLNLSQKLSWFNQWSRLCEGELGRIRPQGNPPANEVHAAAVDVAPILDTQELITRLSL